MIKDAITFALCFLVISINLLPNYLELNKPKPKPTFQDICNSYRVTCNIVVYNSNELNAYVDNQSDNIYVSRYLKDNLTEDEFTAVLLHELGHKVLNHHIRFFKEIKAVEKITNRRITPAEKCIIMRSYEREADIFSQMVASQYKIAGIAGLESFFYKSARLFPSDYTEESCSHPSPNSRVELSKNMRGIRR